MIELWKQWLLNFDTMITRRRPLPKINEGFDDLANNRGIRKVIEITAA
jgi:Zn-dependent alcohol dehydrogenase